MTTLVDANVLLDIVTEDERWMSWSADALSIATARGTCYFPRLRVIAPD